MATEKLILSFATNLNTDQEDTVLNNGGTLTSGATTLTVNTLPAGVTAAQFRIRIDDEIILVGAIGGTGNKDWSSLTRGAEGTTAASHTDGSKVYIVITPAGLLQWVKDTLAAGTALHASTHSPGGVDPVLAYLCYQDQKAQNTAGGTFTSGAWRTRDLNTEVADTGGYGSVASNQITLAAGTYRVQAWASTYHVGNHQVRIQNITDGTTLVLGINCRTSTAQEDGMPGVVSGRFTIAGTKTIELQHRCSTTFSTNGLGVQLNWGTEIYSSIELWKEA